jgi:hypothetical protein
MAWRLPVVRRAGVAEKNSTLWWCVPLVLTIMLIPGFIVALIFGLAAQARADDINLTVDLGYAKYQGYNANNGVSQWWGIRYAAPPVGDLRFKAPQDPLPNSTLQQANAVSLLALVQVVA